jgi:hypothetical protein
MNTIESFGEKYGQKVAAWAIAAMIIYLVIAQ